jgi:dienelactone hydrolase
MSEVNADDCPSEDELAELVELGLQTASAAMSEHLARCVACCDVLASAAVLSASGADPPSADEEALAPGTFLGRYRIVDLLGMGAFGRVYVAFDPELDRQVAIKVLFPGTPDESELLGQRLRREAKAMAKLSHPNVVTVFDVGVSEGRVFLAMELVAGITLRNWLPSARRPWREIVNVFLLAGRGLQAAHSAGLVHRDFKLDNVLVTPEGDVRVTDFGLARLDVEDSRETGGSSDALDSAGIESRITRSGAFVGTPGYMAPEQLDGRPADARSDLFSFCVALWEGLYGKRPFAGSSVAELRVAIRKGAVPETASDVPRAVRDVLLIGLSEDPAQRFQSMSLLLEKLTASNAPHAPSGFKWAVRLAFALALSATAVTAGVWYSRRAAAPKCQAEGDRVGTVWNEVIKHKMHESFVATQRPYADDTFARTVSVLDRYASSWRKHATILCESRRGLPDSLAAARAACMDQRLIELRTFVHVFEHADVEALNLAVHGALSLVGIEECDSPASPTEISIPGKRGRLQAWLWRPAGPGPFPVLVYNHGSERDPTEGTHGNIGPFFLAHGYAVLFPYRRGTGKSDGRPWSDEVESQPEDRREQATIDRLVEENDDIVSAIEWARAQSWAARDQIDVAGCSFGGVEALLTAARPVPGVRAAVDFAGASKSWDGAPLLRERLLLAVEAAKVPVFFVQAENDFNTAPSRILSDAMLQKKLPMRVRIYPRYGSSPAEGHDKFCLQGTAVWGDDALDFLRNRH